MMIDCINMISKSLKGKHKESVEYQIYNALLWKND